MEREVQELLEKVENEITKNEEKDLEVGRMQKEIDELSKAKKNSSEKIIEYQQTNERLRKDKTAMEE